MKPSSLIAVLHAMQLPMATVIAEDKGGQFGPTGGTSGGQPNAVTGYTRRRAR
jgi:hypothetical protein